VSKNKKKEDQEKGAIVRRRKEEWKKREVSELWCGVVVWGVAVGGVVVK
jgi:hypothetical protein